LAQWQLLIAEQGASGLTQQAFCRARGLSTSAFYNAKARLKRTDAGQAMTPMPEFVPVTVEPGYSHHKLEPSWEVELTLGPGVVLRVRRGADGR
jgi:hypothetical protein